MRLGDKVQGEGFLAILRELAPLRFYGTVRLPWLGEGTLALLYEWSPAGEVLAVSMRRDQDLKSMIEEVARRKPHLRLLAREPAQIERPLSLDEVTKRIGGLLAGGQRGEEQ